MQYPNGDSIKMPLNAVAGGVLMIPSNDQCPAGSNLECHRSLATRLYSFSLVSSGVFKYLQS